MPPVALIGVPFDEQSSFSRGSAMAPAMIRSAWKSPSTNLFSENGTCIDSEVVWDAGDVKIDSGSNAFASIETAVAELLSKGALPICLGGDHSITYPILRAFKSRAGSVNVVHFDAHPDIYDSFEGNRHSHACPFARIMEEKLAANLLQIGIRTMTQHTREQISRFNVQVVDMMTLRDDIRVSFDGPTYISVDIDALDPAFAPGVSHREPGGMSTRELIRIIQRMKAQIVGADIVEYNPSRDVPGMTDMVCAKIMKELAAKMLETATLDNGVAPRTKSHSGKRNGKR